MIYSLYYADSEKYQCGYGIIADTDKEAKKEAKDHLSKLKYYSDVSFCRLNGDGTITRIRLK